MKKPYLLLLLTLLWIDSSAQSDITVSELKNHIEFLASEKNAGRYPGTKGTKRVVRYLKKDFKKTGLQSFNNSYTQNFKAVLRVEKGEAPKPVTKACNVLGFLEGNDPELKNEFIVLGAHYDHLGMGGPSSKSNRKNAIHYGADDNASGTATLLEIAEKMASNKIQLKRSVIFIAFGAEEQGLLGSKYFVEHPTVPLNEIKLMINMDMVGRMNSENHVYVNGAGTYPDGVNFIQKLGASLGLTPVVHSGSVGGSDHVSFYKKDLSVMGVHTGAHPQYHKPEDTIDLINFPGQKQISEFIYRAMMEFASTNYPMEFIKQD